MFNENQIVSQQRAWLRRQTRVAANHLAASARKELTVDRGGVPSVPGQFPTTQTGKLKGSVVVRENTISRDRFEFIVIVTADYAPTLVRWHRKMMRSFARKMNRSIRRILAGR